MEIRFWKSFKFFGLSLLCFNLANSSFANDVESTIKQIRGSLINLGFEDLSKEIKQTLKEARHQKIAPGIGPGSEVVLEGAEKSYQILNYSREFALDVVRVLAQNPDSKEIRKQVMELTAQMLSLQPLSGPTKFPARVFSGPSEKLAERQLAFIKHEAEKNMETQARHIVSDYLNVVVGETDLEDVASTLKKHRFLSAKQKQTLNKIRRAQDYARVMISTMYGDTVLGQTRHVGSALANALIIYGMDHHDSGIGQELEAIANREGLDLRNFVGSTVVLPNEKGKPVAVPIRNGDFLMERTPGLEAAAIGAGVRPNVRNAWRAMRNGLVGLVWDVIFPIDQIDRSKMSIINFLRDKISQSKLVNYSVSHIGQAEVRKDPRTGLEKAWAADVYPDFGEGKIRMRMGIADQFALPGPYIRFAMSRYSPEKFWKMAQEQLADREKTTGSSYPAYAFMGEEEERNTQGVLKIKKGGKKIPYSISIPEEEFRRLHQIPEGFETWNEPQKQEFYRTWYEEVMSRSLGEIKRMMLKEGIGFSMDYNPGYGRLYCTQTVWMAAMRGVGLDLQKYPDYWNPVVHLAQALKIKGTADFRTDIAIYHPATFAWQPMTEKITKVTYPKIHPSEREGMKTMDTTNPINPRVNEVLKVINALRVEERMRKPKLDRKFLQTLLMTLGGAGPTRVHSKLANMFNRASVSSGVIHTASCEVLMGRTALSSPGALGGTSEE